MVTRKCKKCNQELPHSEFRANNRSKDGLARNCNKCVAEMHKHKPGRKAIYTPAEIKERRKQQYKEWYQRTKSYHKERTAAYRKQNKDDFARRSAERRAKLKGQSPKLSKSQKLWVKAIYKRAQLLTQLTGIIHHVDHWWPISKGGLHVPWNLYVIPAEDNLRKNDKMPILA